MRLDYWNHPLVTSAFRVRFRGGAPSIMAATYFLGLIILGGVLHHYLAENVQYSWIRVYFICLISIETVIAGLFALLSTHHSMHAEVTNRTLDYQRIAAVPPRDILIGKLLGEPVQGYLMAQAGLPLLIWCCGMGALPPPVLAMLVLQMATTAILMGTVGLVHPLDTSGDKARSSGRLIKTLALVIVGVYVMQMTVVLPFMTNNPLAQIPLGMLTPIFAITGTAREQPALYGLPFFHYELPWLCVTPISQLTIAALILHTMTRRLVNPVNVTLSKPMAYTVLAAIDVLLAGAIMDARAIPAPLEVRVATFCLAHLVFSLLVAFTITPGRDSLKSWLWRFRGQEPRLRDLWLGERSPNGAALATFVVLGVVAAIALVIVPDALTANPSPNLIEVTVARFDVLAAMCLLITALGSLHQLLVSIGSAGTMIFVALVATITAVPHMVVAYLRIPLVVATSPSGQFAHWIAGEPAELPLAPLVACYAALLIAGRYVLWRRIWSGAASVDRVVAKMLADEGGA
jgi:hypothetical protein